MSMYTPDKNGYFVCKDNLLITNTAACSDIYRNSKKINDFRYNLHCAVCKIKLNKINGKSIDDFPILEIELEDYIATISIKSFPSEVISW